MVLFASLLLAFGISIFALSKIIDLLHAKKPEIKKVLLASVLGSISAIIIYFSLKVLMQGLDPLLLVILIGLCIFITYAFSFKMVNGMSWSAAFTATVANFALVLLTSTIAVVLNNISLNSAIKTVQETLNQQVNIIQSVATGEPLPQVLDNAQTTEIMDEKDINTSFKEIDLLPAATAEEIKANKKKVYRTPKYHVVSLNNVQSAVGKNIKVISKSGKTIKGALKSIQGNDITIEQRTNNGVFVASIAVSKIESLEVYR